VDNENLKLGNLPPETMGLMDPSLAVEMEELVLTAE
jgi:hypothetical protein